MNSLGLLPHHSCPAQSSSTPHPWPSQLREGKEGCISYSKQILLPWIPSPLDALRNFIPESPLLSQESSVNHFLPSALPSHLHPHLFLHFSAVMRPYTLRTSSGSSPLLHLWFRWSASLVDVAPPLFFCFLGLHQWHMEVPRLEVESELQLLEHSHSNSGTKPRLRPTPQLTAMPDPWPTEQGQGLNLHPLGS